MAAAVAGVATTAAAADLPLLAQATPVPPPAPSFWDNFYVHLGPTALVIDGAAKIYVPTRLPGATIKINPQVTAGLEAGYRFTPNWAVSLTVGVPPTATIDGAGSITGFGKLGSVVYGPTALTAHYHFTNFGPFQPYVGLGPAYMISFNTHDGSATNLRVNSTWGAVAQVGADYMLNERFGLFVDLKKAYLRTDASGSLAGTAFTAKVKLDPYIISGGLTYRF